MTDRGKLLALADDLEAADGPSLVLDRNIALATYPKARPTFGVDSRITVWDGNGWTQLTVKPYTASLDRAMTLVPEGWQCDRAKWWAEDGASVELIGSQWDGESWVHNFCDGRVRGDAFTPALALCAAALRAQAEALS